MLSPLDIQPDLVRLLLNCPHQKPTKAYGYLYLQNDKISDLLGIISNFTTFAEVWDDLQMINKGLWTLAKFPLEKTEKTTCFTIQGNGFLERISNDIRMG